MEQSAATTSASSLAALRLMLDDPADAPEVVVPLSAAECDLLADDHMVCTCNNVSAGEIRTAMQDGSCASLDDIQVKTRAGGACGHCLPTVAGLVDLEILRARPA
ncbi:(2Fe-2S)-binding protein [Sanguibacter antarcticus]|uniref:Nitrite reductase (NADH) large subunit n=1 Tax=Sanguibacter antarcticus TaxID=372484 RepID=A0A2A9E8Q6_9MICO|nr:(2Fe-2S)-binding protein [Sanguibacter antarcticus]PFG35264.1 nitrite reductase (NADH) large subunit [Sanguibacter antarcticus]